MKPEQPDYKFQRLLMMIGTWFLMEGLIFCLIKPDPVSMFRIFLGLALFIIGIWLIDWEAKRYYESLRRRQHD